MQVPAFLPAKPYMNHHIESQRWFINLPLSFIWINDLNQMVDLKGDINLYKSFNFLSCLTDEESETKKNYTSSWH